MCCLDGKKAKIPEELTFRISKHPVIALENVIEDIGKSNTVECVIYAMIYVSGYEKNYFPLNVNYS